MPNTNIEEAEPETAAPDEGIESSPGGRATDSSTAASGAGPDRDAPAPRPVAELEQEIVTLKDQLLRRRAEFENFRRRVERDRATAGDDAVVALLTNLLPSLDVLEKALDAEGTAEEIRAGVRITLRDIATTLNNRGVVAEDPTGEKFDPLRHEALSYEPVRGAEDGMVVACYRKGYFLGDRLVRPSLVKVAQRATEDNPEIILPASR